MIEHGAWYKCKDYNYIRDHYGIEAAKYLDIPRRVKYDHGDFVTFSTLGDKGKAIGMSGLVSDGPYWPKDLLIQTKSSNDLKYEGKQYRLNSSWLQEYKTIRANGKLLPNFPKPHIIGELFTADHESYSGKCLWLTDNKCPQSWILAPKSHLTEIETATNNSSVKHKQIDDGYCSCGCNAHDQCDKTNCPHHEPIQTSPAEAMIQEDDFWLPQRANGEGPQILDDEKEEYNVTEDPDNDLDNSMVTDLPPQVAKWATEAGIGTEDMIQLSKELCDIQSSVQIAKGREELESKRVQEIQKTERVRIDHTNKRTAKVSDLRHSTLQTLIKWGSVAGTISYLAYILSSIM